MTPTVTISPRGEQRLRGGHPWIYRSDLNEAAAGPGDIVAVRNGKGRVLGSALYSDRSQIAIRMLTYGERPADEALIAARIESAIAFRESMAIDGTAYRLVHGEADLLPSLVVDRYNEYLVVQALSQGMDRLLPVVVRVLSERLKPKGILARNDASVRGREGLGRDVELLHGTVPDTVEVREHGVRYLAAPRTGQKTGAFLDQREARVLAASVARGRALDVFSYHGSFALHLARRAESVTAVDASGAAIARAAENAALNGLTNITGVEADAFDFLRAEEGRGARYETIVLDPPAFAKNRGSIEGALRGYKDINLRAMRLLAPGGMLYTASCSYHVGKAEFLAMLGDAAADSGRRMILRQVTGQPVDHPEVVTIPETGYLKGALLEAGQDEG